jgi:hypothetical protein
MQIDPIDTHLVMPMSPSPASDPAQLASAQSEPRPVALEHAPSPPTAWQSPQHEVNVVLDQKLNIVYKFVDKDTGVVIEQIPPEESLRMIENIQQLLEKPEPNLKVTG